MLLDLVAHLFGVEEGEAPPAPPPIVVESADASGGLHLQRRVVGFASSIAAAAISTGEGSVLMVGRAGVVAGAASAGGAATVRVTGRGALVAPLTRALLSGQVARAGELIVVVEAELDEDVQVVLRA